MQDLKARWAAVFDRCIAEDMQSTTLAPTAEVVPIDTYSVQGAVQDTADDMLADTAVEDLPVHEATKGQIEAWHAWRDFYTLRNFLYQHDLNWYHKIFSYDIFKVGLDRGRQLATFAIDDTHYLSFTFDEKTGQAKDYAEACRVLAKINTLRNIRCLP